MRQYRYGGARRKIYVGAGDLWVGQEGTLGLEDILGGWNWEGRNGAALAVWNRNSLTSSASCHLL